MIIIYLSVRGVEHAPKILALKILVMLYKTKNIILKETMVLGARAIELMSSLLLRWSFSAHDVDGFSGGLLTS